ncbi:hypothetical protein FRC09_015426, partial [Ceratobasidium sp. 395]
MRQAAISVGRILRSALDTVVVSAGPWNKKGSSGFTSLSFPRTKNKDVSRLSCRLSQKLASTGVSGSPVVPHTGGARSLTGRAKKRRAGKQEAKKNSSGRTKLKPIKKSSTSYSNTQSQWTAVGAALGSLEESISRTNLLLHSLASGEAWARRTRSPGSRPSRDANAALDSSSGRRTPGLADTTEALTSLLQELGQKQAVAADLLSRLDRSTSDALANTSSQKPFENVLSNKLTNQLNESQIHGKLEYESNWGPDTLAPPSAKSPTPPSELLFGKTAAKNDARPADIPLEKLQGIVEPGN